jgi:N-acetylmuramoyl-L-alanine amidase
MLRALSALLLLCSPFRRIQPLWPLAASFLAASSLHSHAAFEWKVVSIDGRDYVSASDVKKFYGFPSLRREGRAIWFRSQALIMKWSPGADDIFINNVKFCLSFPIEDRNGEAMVSRVDLAKLLHPIIRPSHIQNAVPFNTVVIDAGHGGEDSGAVGPYGSEKNYTLDTAFRLKKRLEAAGYKTVLTRSTDVFITRPGRVAIANKYPTAIFVSIHFNSFGSSAAGLETFALAPAGTANTDKALKESDFSMRRGNERDSENIALATAVHANCLARLRGIDRGVKRDRFDVLTGILRPGILVEGGFVSNPAEGAKIHRPEYRENLAEAILGGIQNYRKALLRGRSGGATRVPLRAGVAGSPPPESKPIPIPPKSEKPSSKSSKKDSPKDAPKEDPKSPATKEEPKPAEASKPKEDPKPADGSTPKEAPKPADGPTPKEEPKPADAPAPKEEPKPADAPAPKEEPKPADGSAPKEAPKPTEGSVPKEDTKPSETPKEDSKPAEGSAPKDEPKPTEGPTPKEDTKPSEAPKEDSKPADVPAPKEEPKPADGSMPKEDAKPTETPKEETKPKPAAKPAAKSSSKPKASSSKSSSSSSKKKKKKS